MTYDEAVTVLRNDGEWSRLCEAVTVLMQSPQATVDDFALALRYQGWPAEQAAFRLHKMTGQPLPKPIDRLIENICNHLGLSYDPVQNAAVTPAALKTKTA